MMWPAWPKGNEKDLARYVAPRVASTLRLPVNRDGLLARGNRVEVLAGIYRALAERDIRYAREPYDSTIEHQHIRPPSMLLSGSGDGTCLDLALLFAGACLGNELLPVVVVLRGHALVLVSQRFGRRDAAALGRRHEHGGWSETGLLTTSTIAPIEAADVLRQLIDRGDFVAVECTGFARAPGMATTFPEGLGRVDGLLPFPLACRAGRAQLDCPDREFLFAVDVAVLLDVFKIPPLDDDGGVIPGLDELRELRRKLLADVKREVTARQEQSLHHAVVVNLHKTKHPQAVTRPWDSEIKITPPQPASLPLGTEMIDIFDAEAVDGNLLILGAPGAGKTTALLQLAQNLVDRSETDSAQPTPVLLNLSSWVDESVTIASWLVGELRKKYGVRNDMGRSCVKERCLLPLLDGLDELDPARVEKCIHAINEFRQTCQPVHLVVCCRLAEYQNCEVKLQLNDAVHLEPLTEHQIHGYLTEGACPGLWNDISADPELLELARSPLLLTMMTFAYETGSTPEKRPSTPTQDARRYLFDLYIERMLARPITGRQYPKQKIMRWLPWLAEKLRAHAQPELLLERLQPSWLASRSETFLYRAGVFVTVALIIMLLRSASDAMLGFLPDTELDQAVQNWLGTTVDQSLGFRIDTPRAWRHVGLVMNVVIGLIAGFVIGRKQTITPIESLRWSWAKAWMGFRSGSRSWSIAGAKVGAYIGLIAGVPICAMFAIDVPHLGRGPDLVSWGQAGKIAGIASGLMAGVATVLIVQANLWRTAQLSKSPIIKSVDSVIGGLIFGLAAGLHVGLPRGVNTALVVGSLFALSIGIMAELGHSQRATPGFTVADGLIIGLIGWPLYGVPTWLIGTLVLKYPWQLSTWLDIWFFTWIGLGLMAGLGPLMIAKLREEFTPAANQKPVTIRPVSPWSTLRWHRWLTTAGVAAFAWSLIFVLLLGFGGVRAVQAMVTLSSSLGLAAVTVLGPIMLFPLLGAATAVFLSVVLGALLGALASGLTGPDIERRKVPNQGIRQSAANAGWFALIGGFTLGSFWGLQNVTVQAVATGRAPHVWNWWREWIGGVLFLALLCALVPGAACIQHFMLRVVLALRGVTPWRYARFLDYATERMFLQRIGGSYRFVHELLRDHFAAMAPASSRLGRDQGDDLQ